MRWLLFFSRVAFICNICFLIGFSLRYLNWIQNPDLVSTVIIIGWVLVFLFNPVVNIFYLIYLVLRNKALKTVPVWLITSNVFFLVIELLFILVFNNSKSFE